MRVLIVGGVRLHREGLGCLLDGRAEVRVVGLADAAEAVAAVCTLRPDMIVLDLSSADGHTAARCLLREVPDARIVALGIDEEPDTVVGCAEAGIAGYAPRDCTVEQLVATLTSVERGELPCSPRVAAVLFRRLAARNRSRDASGDGAGAVSHVVPPATATPRAPVRPAASEARRLTAREQEILALIDHGLSNKQIAEELRITAATVKNHVHSILEKLDVCRRGQAAALVRARLTGVPVRPAERHERDGVSTLDPCPFGRRLDRTAYGGPPTG